MIKREKVELKAVDDQVKYRDNFDKIAERKKVYTLELMQEFDPVDVDAKAS
jgi:hypothetical protein